jgi:hypothetical protein
MNREAWLNGITPMRSIWGISAYLANGTYTVQANAPDTLGASSFSLGTYAAASDVNQAVAAFAGSQGYPWVTIGDAASIVRNDNEEADYVIALNLGSAFVPGLSSGTSGFVVTSNRSISTPGYSPWGNYTEAMAALLALVGNSAWPA